MASLNREYFAGSSHTSVCPWKGSARYFDVVIDSEVNPAAACCSPKPSAAAVEITDHVAFWDERAMDGGLGALERNPYGLRATPP